jgi:hypothetical protein
VTRVLASATVDKVQDVPCAAWEVAVEGWREGEDLTAGQRRVYRIEAASDTLAAQEGIRRFVGELEAEMNSDAEARPPLAP